jgi:adenylate cyclase
MMLHVRDELRDFLLRAGVTDDDIRRAEAEGWLPLLALDSRLTPGRPRYDAADLARELGVDEALVRQLWRSLGFPDVPPGVALFSDHDRDAARLLLRGAYGEGMEPGLLVRIVRVSSLAMSRIAAVEAESLVELLQTLRASGLAEDEIALELVEDVDWDALAQLIDYAHRIQLRAALWRRLAYETASDLAIAVGFVDLSGYTALSASLDPGEISALIGRWEEVAYDVAAAHGGRVVKMIGDEVMFVGLPGAAARAALSLRDAAAADPALLPARGGVAAGMVVARDGDFYGPVVNLASRLAQAAAAGAVLVPAELCEELDRGEFRCDDDGTRSLRGIGDVPTRRLEWAGANGGGPASGRR